MSSTRKKQAAAQPEGLTSRQAWPDGTVIDHAVQVDGDRFVCVSSRDGRQVSREALGPVAAGLLSALATRPDVLEVGTGLTEISTTGPVSVPDLLGLLVVADPDAPMVEAEAWTEDLDEDDEPIIDVDDCSDQDEEMTAIKTLEGMVLVPRWVTINEDRGFVLRGEGFAAVGLVDPQSDWNQPMLTADLLSWGFYGESGGPCTWDGGAELGWCGPRLWGFKRWGDIDPECAVFPAPAPDELAAVLAAWIAHLGWELPYVLAAVGMPGLDDADRDGLWSAADVEGPWVSTSLGDDHDAQVVEILCEQWPELLDAVDGLRDPDSERGRLVYAWLRQIAHGDYQSGSWNQVHAAMLGHIDPPADDQRAPTMAERWDEHMRRVESVIQQALDETDSGQ